jgi:hypothetical protein
MISALTVRSMTTFTIPLLALLFSFPVYTPQQSVLNRRPPLIWIAETIIDHRPSGITGSSCVAVQSDGRFHFETHIQQLPRLTSVMHIYEGTLDSFQMSRLNSILDSHAVRDMGTYNQPKLPVSALTLLDVRLEVAQADGIRMLGYFNSERASDPNGIVAESASEELKEEWRASRIALAPLVGWVHEVESMKWPELAASHPTYCRDSSAES